MWLLILMKLRFSAPASSHCKLPSTAIQMSLNASPLSVSGQWEAGTRASSFPGGDSHGTDQDSDRECGESPFTVTGLWTRLRLDMENCDSVSDHPRLKDCERYKYFLGEFLIDLETCKILTKNV